MNRAFIEHIKRKTFLLDGVWEFKADNNDTGEKEEWYKTFPGDVTEVAVPSCINTRIGMMEFNGIAWFKKAFYTDGGNIKLTFGSVSEYAKVYLDGEYLGEHYGSFTAFSFTKNVKAGEHTLILRVDPRPTEDTIPLYRVDWYHYCGIMRSVEVSYLPDISIDNAFFRYELSDDLKDAKLHITTKLINNTDSPKTCTLAISLDEKEMYFEEKIDVTGTVDYTLESEIKDVRLWDIGKGELYTLKIETENDDFIDRIGFRKIETRGKEILLNNKRVVMKGVNRHEDHPDWGFALPINLMQRDMDILKDLGVNTVRGSHYPNNKYFVDMCDSEGILFWSEIPMWGFHEEDLVRPLVIERGVAMHKEMVTQYFNHPSIVIWGLHNECATDTEAGINITKTFAETIKSFDTSRLLTFATNRVLKDICFEYVDFISVNQYTGWYEGELEDWADFVASMKARLKEIGMDSKPVLFSEFGVGAMFGVKTFDGLRWTENYQQEYYDHTINLFLSDNDLSGVYLWQFCDIRSNAKWSMVRVRSFNNKGIVNEHREPKLAYYKTKELFAKYK